MQTSTFAHESLLDGPQAEVFDYHSRPAALERLLPPRQRVSIERYADGLHDGSRAEFRLHLGPLNRTWLAVHEDCRPPEGFTDVQESGPFAFWRHTHQFRRSDERFASEPASGSTANNTSGYNSGPTSGEACRLIDRVEYRLFDWPLQPLRMLGDQWVERQLLSMFAYRHRVTAADIPWRRKYRRLAELAGVRKIAISGGSGMIGRRVSALANLIGLRVMWLRRTSAAFDSTAVPRSDRKSPPYVDQSPWHPDSGSIAAEDWRDVDAFIHLAGENIAAPRWTDGHKHRLRTSRVDATERLMHSLYQAGVRPPVMVTASGSGYYASTPTIATEDAAAAGDFMGQLAQDWESASRRSYERDGRWAACRFGMVLDPLQGALVPLWYQSRIYAAGQIGDGQQHWPWIERDDAAAVLLHLTLTPDARGPFNATGEPLTNRDFVQKLTEVVGGWAWARAPEVVVRTALGEMAEALLLRDNHLSNDKLKASGYTFRYEQLSSALAHLLT